MNTRKFLSFIILCLSWLPLAADRYEDYVAAYADMAVAEMHRSGVPASITLSQGLLESAAGASTLASEGNNHFGIKCHNDWQGETMLRDDDALGECFRVYPSAADSFADHSRFLQRRRYAPLFELDPTDYAGWAHGLKSCGYATDPNYALRLIAIIERYGLYRYDHGAEEAAALDAEYIASRLRSRHAISRSAGRYFVIAWPGDTYESIAAELNLNPEALAAANDNCEITDWIEIYLK
ncbi:MAG: glucosaminidase domain-containing protein [Muribaculaceae bacterium]|nr:glucosaminidase domain-containing protein [Bacteroidales bacterium]MDE6243211.1 glucosaminidase domain-containing protein [Muribaculaceae bacterium]